jgi:Spy/CpxP family protein refolding chaperone
MYRIPLLALLVFIAGAAATQDPKDDKKDPPPKLKGTLPQGWGKLGLTADQKQKIYKVHADHRAKIEALQKELETLKMKQRVEMEKVLTKEQLAQLKKEPLPEKDRTSSKGK